MLPNRRRRPRIRLRFDRRQQALLEPSDALAVSKLAGAHALHERAVLIGAGWVLGDNWEAVEGYVGYLQYVVLAIAAAALAWWVWVRIIHPRSTQA
jgi:hypothetical protein